MLAAKHRAVYTDMTCSMTSNGEQLLSDPAITALEQLWKKLVRHSSTALVLLSLTHGAAHEQQ